MANTKITNPELFNLGDSTSATQLPVMTTTERIAMTGLSVGEMIFNSTTDKVEYWDGTKWYGITYEVIYPTSLKMYLDASNTTSYPPPQTGSTWFDLTSNANNGTISGATWNPGGYFDVTGASNSGINIAGLTTQITPNGNDSTMGGWFKKDNTNWGTFWSKGCLLYTSPSPRD